MKNLIISLILLISFSANANLDKLIGNYEAPKDLGSKAEIKKVMVTSATLFEPAKYEYRLKMDPGTGNSTIPYLRYVKLELSEEKDSLIANFEEDCDDPGCFYYMEINILAKISRKGYPYIKISYDGFYTADGDSDGYDFDDEFFFFKR